jgi:hypothetical protein
MTQIIAHLVNCLVIDSDDGFDEVRQRYESLVPATDFAELTEVINTGNLAKVQQYTAEHAPHSFLNFWTLNPTPMMRLGRSWHPGGGSRLRADPSRRPTPSPFCQGGRRRRSSCQHDPTTSTMLTTVTSGCILADVTNGHMWPTDEGRKLQ